MKKSELKQIIKEEIIATLNENAVPNMGAFRRVVISSSKIKEIENGIKQFMDKPIIKSDYPMNKFIIKSGIEPETIVIDIEGKGAMPLTNKLSDLAKKIDKEVNIKIKKEIKLK